MRAKRMLMCVLWPWAWFKHRNGPLCCYPARGEVQCTCGQYALTWEEKVVNDDSP